MHIIFYTFTFTFFTCNNSSWTEISRKCVVSQFFIHIFYCLQKLLNWLMAL